MVLSGYLITWNILFVPFIIILTLFFSIGVAFITSALTVYVRDVSPAVGIIMGYLMFSVPIIYLSSQRSTPFMELIWHINPLFYQIESIHDALYFGRTPDLFYMFMVLLSAVITLVVGWIIFRKLEPKFAEKL